MITIATMPTAELNDADLVAESLKGNREAFRQIVERYQTLISSLAYCSTGNVSLSEDLAQETFVTAWNRLSDLREPAKLRPWLCGINRFLISKAFRRLDREPSHAAETLEAAAESPALEPLPPDHVISNEEKAILWRSVGQIPEIYREPLVLFYREHQSIEMVARSLDLSEDAVKQRLTRGRKLLHEQVLAFVETALEKTKPDKAFALGVLAALPLAVTTAKAATATVAIKGGSSLKAASSFAMLGAVLTAGALFSFSLIGFFVFTGGCLGYMMARSCKRSARDLNSVIAFWRLLAWTFLAIVAPALLLSYLVPKPVWNHDWFPAATIWLRLVYPLTLVALGVWLVRWWRALRQPELAVGALDAKLKRQFGSWFALGMLVPGLITANLLYSLIVYGAGSNQFVPVAEAQTMLQAHKDAKVTLEVYASGSKTLWITLPDRGRHGEYFTVPDEAALALLDQSGIKYTTQVEGRDFTDEGVTWHGLFFLALFIMSVGGMVMAGRPWRMVAFAQPEPERRRDEGRSRKAFKALAVAMSLVLLALGFSLGMMMLGEWTAHWLKPAEVPGIVAQLKGPQFTVYQYRNGTRELRILSERSHGFVAPADAATLAFLADNGIHYRTLVQGRDFGYGLPNRWLGAFYILLLIGGAGWICWRASPRIAAVLTALVLLAPCLLLGLATSWHAHALTKAAAADMIAAHPAGQYELIEYSNGSMELFITPNGGKTHPGFIAPADESTAALLTANKIAFKTYSQGRDFGFRMPKQGSAVLWICALAGGAGLVLWLAWRRKPAAE
jgi:RNA polymerase sigma factor (sigma-70 family)